MQALNIGPVTFQLEAMGFAVEHVAVSQEAAEPCGDLFRARSLDMPNLFDSGGALGLAGSGLPGCEVAGQVRVVLGLRLL